VCIKFQLITDTGNFNQFTVGQYDSAQYVRVDGTTVHAVNLKPGLNTAGIGKPYESLLGLLGQNVRTPQVTKFFCHQNYIILCDAFSYYICIIKIENKNK
jgi:hypothetical protein